MSETRHNYNICLNCYGTLDQKRICDTCGARADDSPNASYAIPKRTLLNGKYLISHVLGKGGFGTTYLAWDTDKRTKVAVKEYYPEAYGIRLPGELMVTAKKRELQPNYEHWKELFVGEAIALFKLRDLPGIVSVKEYFPLHNTAYIVMEFLEGVTLSKYLDRTGGRLPVPTALSLIRPVMLSLINIHQRGMLHRDISPDNIIIVQNKYVKLIDFGGVKRDMFDQSNGVGTLKPGYSPIEQYYTDRKQSTYTDVYALSATLYRTITGRTPPEATQRIKAETLLMPSRMGIDLPPVQERAILKALNINPNERFQSIGDFLNALFGPNATSQLSTNGNGVINANDGGPQYPVSTIQPVPVPAPPLYYAQSQTHAATTGGFPVNQHGYVQLPPLQPGAYPITRSLHAGQKPANTQQILPKSPLPNAYSNLTPQQLAQLQKLQMQQMQMQQMQMQQIQQMQMQMLKFQQQMGNIQKNDKKH